MTRARRGAVPVGVVVTRTTKWGDRRRVVELGRRGAPVMKSTAPILYAILGDRWEGRLQSEQGIDKLGVFGGIQSTYGAIVTVGGDPDDEVAKRPKPRATRGHDGWLVKVTTQRCAAHMPAPRSPHGTHR